MTTSGPVFPGSLVCVTGANGFIASHLIGRLLDEGYRVRGTVRDPSNEAKTAHLKAMAAERDAADRLELVAADLLKPGSFDAAVAGCDGVFHAAAAVFFAAEDPQRDIVDPSIEGTRNVFSAIAKAGTVQRVVHTSSIAAIYDWNKPKSHTFTEADWNEGSTLALDPYGLAKVSAEREAVKLAAEVTGDAAYELVHLNPGMVWGPPLIKAHAKASPLLVRDLVSGARPGAPKLHLGIVDVRDVAELHLQAMRKPGLSGRYLLVADHAWMPEVARRIQALFPRYKIPTMALPNLLVFAFSLVDSSLNTAQLRKLLGRPFPYDATRVREDFDISFRDLDTTLRDTVETMVVEGWARTKER